MNQYDVSIAAKNATLRILATGVSCAENIVFLIRTPATPTPSQPNHNHAQRAKEQDFTFSQIEYHRTVLIASQPNRSHPMQNQIQNENNLF